MLFYTELNQSESATWLKHCAHHTFTEHSILAWIFLCNNVGMYAILVLDYHVTNDVTCHLQVGWNGHFT